MSDSKYTWDDVAMEYIETFRHLGIFYEVPDGTVPLLSHPDKDVCYSLKDETPESVHDRIQRSKEAGRNLFFEECPEYEIESEPGVEY